MILFRWCTWIWKESKRVHTPQHLTDKVIPLNVLGRIAFNVFMSSTKLYKQSGNSVIEIFAQSKMKEFLFIQFLNQFTQTKIVTYRDQKRLLNWFISHHQGRLQSNRLHPALECTEGAETQAQRSWERGCPLAWNSWSQIRSCEQRVDPESADVYHDCEFKKPAIRCITLVSSYSFLSSVPSTSYVPLWLR